MSFEEINAFLFPSVSVAHYQLVNQVQSARIRLLLARLGIYIYIYNRSNNNFKAILKTFYHHLNDLA